MLTEVSKVTRCLLIAFLVGFCYAPVYSELAAAELPQYAPQKHLGVASCANSVCHALRVLEQRSNVEQNEYLVWQLHDQHARAYTTLLSSESQRIAEKLGLKDAASADICLDCHADNIPLERRGPEFQITDGVGCEACHGGSEIWLSRHTLLPYDAARNTADGMYPTGPLEQRATLCVSCHVGSEKKLANHRIMGAGHPRLGFELDTFTIRQPDHYRVDADYLQRKNPDNHLARLLTGTAIHAQSVARNLSGKLVASPQGHPEIALYDCHSCHHSLTDLQWQKRPSTAGLEPGMVRLNDSSFLLLSALTAAVDQQLQSNLLKAIKELHSASSRSVPAVVAAAGNLERLAQSAQQAFTNVELSVVQRQRMLAEVMALGIRGEYHDYIAAEQGVMAMDALSFSLPENQALAELINNAYKLTANDETYQPAKLKRALSEYLAR